DRVVPGRLVRDDGGHVFPGLGHPTAQEVPWHAEEAVANQPGAVLVALVQDLDGDGPVHDLPADRAELPRLAATRREIRRALVHDTPDLLRRGVHLERVAVLLHGGLLEPRRCRGRSWPSAGPGRPTARGGRRLSTVESLHRPAVAVRVG